MRDKISGIIPKIKKILFGEEKERRPELVEVAGDKKEWLTQWIGDGEFYLNPDPTLEAAGSSSFSTVYELYREMMIKWPHFRHTIRKRINAVVSQDMIVNAMSNDDRDVEVAESCRNQIKGIISFKDDMKELLDGILCGFAVSEIIYQNGKNGIYWGIKELMNRKQERFRFKQDGTLCLDRDGCRVTFDPVPENKFVIYQYNKEHENPYGQGEGKFNYWYYWFAKNAVKFWNIFTEKFAMPTVIGKYPPGIGDAEKAGLLAALKTIQTDQAIRIPDNMVVEFLEAERAGSFTSYDNFIRYLELSVSKNILGGTLTSDEGKYGTRAQAEVHESGRLEVTESDCASLAGTLQDQVFRPLVLFNFGEGVQVPEIEFDLSEAEDLESRARTDEILVRIGVPLGKEYFYEAYGRPEPKLEENSERGSRKAEQGKEKEENGERGTRNDEKGEKFGEGEEEREIAGRWELDEVRYMANAVSKGKKFYFDLMKWIREGVENAESEEAVFDLRRDLAEGETQRLASYLAAVIFTARLNGMLEIKRMGEKKGVEFGEGGTRNAERGRGNVKEGGIEKFIEGEYVFEPLVPEEAIEYFQGLIPMTREEMEGMLREVRFVAFTVSDIQRKDVIEKIQDRLTKSLAEGRTFGDWKKGIGEMFQAEGVAPLNDFRLQTIFQTNIHRALVEGRDRMCQDLVRQGVMEYGRWQTVGDSRVRDKHAEMNGQVMRWDDPRWKRMEDYNCRCQKVPVFRSLKGEV